MKPQAKALFYSILLGVLFYTVDSVLDYILFYKDLGFFQVFIANPPIQELYTRLIGMAFIVILGMILPRLLTPDLQFDTTSVKQEHKISSDPALMVSVSNQIKTPLNAIMGFVELLRDPHISDISRDLYLGHIRTSGRYLSELINNVTDITMVETGQLYIKEEDCRLNEMLSDLYNQYDNYIREKGKKELAILLKTGIRDDTYTIRCDRDRLKQVLTNLLENSLNFTDEGIIEFGYHLIDERTLEFYVKDTGAGFSMERMEMIFNQFSRILDSRMRPFDLASLRINISKRLVKLMGGELKADSQLGQGSDFRFQIALKHAKAEITEITVEKTETREKGAGVSDEAMWKGKNILIAEDVESNFIYLQEILRPTGANISWAENGKVAVGLCMKNRNFDVVLMDVLMPEMDGYEAAKEIKKEFPDLPVIAQTAYHLEEGDYKDAMNYFQKYLIKPIWSHDLINALKEYLS